MIRRDCVSCPLDLDLGADGLFMAFVMKIRMWDGDKLVENNFCFWSI